MLSIIGTSRRHDRPAQVRTCGDTLGSNEDDTPGGLGKARGDLTGGGSANVLHDSFRPWEVLNESFKTFGRALPPSSGSLGGEGRGGLRSR